MNRSTNLNLYLPESSDYIAVSQLDYNFETIDSAVGTINSKLANSYGQIATGITYQKQADVVTIFINTVQVTAASTWTSLATLPSSLKTRYSIHFNSLDGTAIRISGTTISYRGSASEVFGAFTYVADPDV